MPGGMVGAPGDGGSARSRHQASLCRYLRALGTKVETRAPGALLWVQLGPPPHASESGGAVTPPSLRGWRTSSRTQHSRVTPSPTLPGSLSHLCSGVTSCATSMHTDLSGDCSPGCRRVDCSGGCCAARLGRAQLSSGRRGSVSRRPVQDTAGPAAPTRSQQPSGGGARRVCGLPLPHSGSRDATSVVPLAPGPIPAPSA